MHTFQQGVEFKLLCSDKKTYKPSYRCTDFSTVLSVVVGGGSGVVVLIAYFKFLQTIHIVYPASN